MKIPKFDKSIDDRLPKKKWQKVEKNYRKGNQYVIKNIITYEII